MQCSKNQQIKPSAIQLMLIFDMKYHEHAKVMTTFRNTFCYFDCGTIKRYKIYGFTIFTTN